MSHKAAEVMKDSYDDLLEAMRKSKVAYMDETSWYVGNPDYWLWVLTNEDHTLYHVIDSRTRQVIYDLLGKDYKGVLVSDCLSIYDDVHPVDIFLQGKRRTAKVLFSSFESTQNCPGSSKRLS